jgi:hypothetical protein
MLLGDRRTELWGTMSKKCCVRLCKQLFPAVRDREGMTNMNASARYRFYRWPSGRGSSPGGAGIGFFWLRRDRSGAQAGVVCRVLAIRHFVDAIRGWKNGA